MVIDGRSLTEADEVKADVCIVGAGPAGISIALDLARAGVEVCVLESGGRKPEAAAQKLNEGKSVGNWYYPLATTRSRSFGGTSAHWFRSQANMLEGWRARPLDPVDFEARPGLRYSGWPFGRNELEPFYERAQKVCQLGPYDYDLASWESEDARALRLDARTTSAIFHQGFDTFVSYFEELARTPRLRLILHATALQIETDDSAREVTRLVVGSLPSARFSVRARVYVLAAGGIESARLLLLSRGSQPSGLGNGEDLVGRFFMERLSGRTGYIAPAKPELLDQIALYAQRTIGSTVVHGVLCPSNDVVREEGILNCAFFLVPHAQPSGSEGVRSAATLYRALRRRPLPGNFVGHTRNVITGLDDIARMAFGMLPGASQHAIVALRVQAEQSPNPDSRVTLDSRRDQFGLPRVRLDWRINEFDRWSIRRVQDILDQKLRTAGLGRIEFKLGEETPPSLFLGNNHHVGTTRMHNDPKLGVVDANCRVHGVSNLFVAGSSVFPTSGYANPTLTVVALALRLAEHLQNGQARNA